MELFRALGALAEGAGDAQQRIAETLGLGPLDPADHTDLFEFSLYPYASVYLGAEGMLGGEARDRIAGFWRALGLTPPDEPDHLATLLAFYAELRERGSDERVARSRAAFFWEHLASWLPVYLQKARTIARGAYVRWADLLWDAIEAEAETLPPGALALHLREAPAFPAAGECDDEALVAALLSPVRAGFILVRDDLRRVSEILGTGIRQGERRYALLTLLRTERAAVRRELAILATEAAEAHAALRPVYGGVGDFWEGRARVCARTLER